MKEEGEGLQMTQLLWGHYPRFLNLWPMTLAGASTPFLFCRDVLAMRRYPIMKHSNDQLYETILVCVIHCSWRDPVHLK
jgi:hypothetical protein